MVGNIFYGYGNTAIRNEVNVLRAKASNINGSGGPTYTAEMFYEDYPQFKNKATGEGHIPAHMLAVFLNMCNSTVTIDRWGEAWRLACALFVAHYATMFLRQNQGNQDGTTTAQQAADSGALLGIVTSASLGDANVSYDVSNVTGATALWGQFNLTSYGQQYASLARIYALGGSYVI